MKQLALAASVCLASLSVASAADMPVKAAPVVYVPPSWSGFYGGGNVGYLVEHDPSGVVDFNLPQPPVPKKPPPKPYDPQANISAGADGVSVGAQVGYNWQFAPQYLVGVEGDWEYVNPRTGYTTSLSVFSYNQRTEWLASLRGRVGYLWSPTLMFYGTAGPAWGDVKTTLVADPVNSGSFDSVRSGWAAGLGAEAMLTPNWIARAEYLHYDLGTLNTVVQSASYSRHLLYDLVRVGISYKL
jgi:outer membrane immunogenic protein